MSTIKHVHLVGRAGRDIERVADTKRAKFTLAVETGYNKDTKERLTTWYDVTVWDALADRLTSEGPMIRRGNMIWVSGTESTWGSMSGDRPQISAREIGYVDRIRTDVKPGIKLTFPKKIVADAEFDPETVPVMDGVDEEKGDW